MMFLLQVFYKWYHYYLYMLAGSMIKDERDMNRKKFFYGIFRFAVCIIDSSKHSRTGNMIGRNWRSCDFLRKTHDLLLPLLKK